MSAIDTLKNDRNAIISIVAEFYLDDKWLKQAKIDKFENHPRELEVRRYAAWFFVYDHQKNVIYIK